MTLRQPLNPDLPLERTFAAEVTCRPCGGTGEISWCERGEERFGRCPACDGAGTVWRNRPIPRGDSE